MDTQILNLIQIHIRVVTQNHRQKAEHSNAQTLTTKNFLNIKKKLIWSNAVKTMIL